MIGLWDILTSPLRPFFELRINLERAERMSAGAVTFDDVEAVVSSIASPGIRPGLERIERLLCLLGKPQDAFFSIHVVGTNGKGSVCSFLASVFKASGYKTAFYSSPHLENPVERLLINGSPLSPESWMNAAERAAKAIETDSILSSEPPSYFEVITAVAFLLTAEEKAEIAIVEAGLGGRLDATNLLGNVACSAVTSISMDHTEYLGDTLEKIAGEKFAVVRSGKPACFLGDKEELVTLFRETCSIQGAEPFLVSEDVLLKNVAVTDNGCTFDFTSKNLKLSGVRTGLLGRYQVSNAAMALLVLSCVRNVFDRLSDETILLGLKSALWPGRMEVISKKPLVILDGGHNADGVAKLKESVAELWGAEDKKIGIVYAVMKDKDYKICLKLLSELNAAIYAVAVPGMARSLSASELVREANSFSWRNLPRGFDSPLDAISAAIEENDLVLVCGSLYLIGWIRPKLRDFLSINYK